MIAFISNALSSQFWKAPWVQANFFDVESFMSHMQFLGNHLKIVEHFRTMNVTNLLAQHTIKIIRVLITD